MSIASNVIETNTRLATARTLLRQKLSDNGIIYDESDTIFELLKRWAYTRFAGSYSYFFPDEIEVREGGELSAGVTISDNDGNRVEGVPATVTVNGTSYKVYSDSNGNAQKTFIAGAEGTELEIKVTAGSETSTYTYTIKSALEFIDNGDQNTFLYDVIKYPSDISYSFSSYNYDSRYSKYGYLLSKATTSASAVMLIPKGLQAYNPTENGIHFQVQMVQKKNSNSGWADAIALVNSKELSHYRDNKILELGAYNSKKGIKYSNTNHVVNELNTTSGQLTLDSVWYTFDMYYDNGYLKATIKNGSTTVYSYEGNVSNIISFDKFYPVIMVYDYGGAMLFNNVIIEPWSND